MDPHELLLNAMVMHAHDPEVLQQLAALAADPNRLEELAAQIVGDDTDIDDETDIDDGEPLEV